MTHVQFVSRAARSIARALNLNEDLCEAISLAHDVGHTPFGHTGESILNDISMEKLGQVFAHNLNSVRILSSVRSIFASIILSISLRIIWLTKFVSDTWFAESMKFLFAK